MWCAEDGCVNYADSMPARLFSNLGMTCFKRVHFLADDGEVKKIVKILIIWQVVHICAVEAKVYVLS